MGEKHMEHIEKSMDALFAVIEQRGSEAVGNFEKHGMEVVTKFEKKMVKAFNMFWAVLSVLVIIGLGYMLDSNKVMASKANASDLINYSKSTDVIESLRLDYMMNNDCYVVKDSAALKRYEQRYMWQIETILNKNKDK